MPRGALLAAGAVALIGLAVVGRSAQEDYLELRYSSAAPDYPRGEQPAIELGQGLGAAYDWARGIRNQEIGLSGTTGALFGYGLWGPDASNPVRYLGERGDRGSFREITECPELIGAINQDGDFDFVVTTPGVPPGRSRGGDGAVASAPGSRPSPPPGGSPAPRWSTSGSSLGRSTPRPALPWLPRVSRSPPSRPWCRCRPRSTEAC